MNRRRLVRLYYRDDGFPVFVRGRDRLGSKRVIVFIDTGQELTISEDEFNKRYTKSDLRVWSRHPYEIERNKI
tara:strand:+ start:1186 stop:1404 length:219 start_codon:yes stop_codon:yes gene_type:complete